MIRGFIIYSSTFAQALFVCALLHPELLHSLIQYKSATQQKLYACTGPWLIIAFFCFIHQRNNATMILVWLRRVSLFLCCQKCAASNS